VRLFVTTVAAVLLVATAGACTHDKELKESPQQISQEQAAADAHNADTVPFAGDDEAPATSEPVTSTIPIVVGGDQLFAGDCVDQPAGDAVDVREVTCSQPHHAEVTARVDLGPRFGGVYPTDQQQKEVRDTDCARALEGYTGHGPTADIGVGYYGPSPDRWNEPSQRYMICLAEASQEGNVLTASVRKPT
jgi:hypothetical protein